MVLVRKIFQTISVNISTEFKPLNHYPIETIHLKHKKIEVIHIYTIVVHTHTHTHIDTYIYSTEY